MKRVYDIKKYIRMLLTILIVLCIAIPAAPVRGSNVVLKDFTMNSVACFKNKLYIAAGNSGTIRISTNGKKWTSSGSIQVSSNLLDIVCTDKQIIVVGDNGTVLRSTNGSIWKKVKAVTQNRINHVIYGNSTFVAVTDGQGEILTSKDGLLWTKRKIDSKFAAKNTVFNGKVFVTVGGGGEICTSNDGIRWKCQIIHKDHPFEKVIWNGSIFVTIGALYSDSGSELYTAASKDGINWTINPVNGLPKEIGEYGSLNIVWNGKGFFGTVSGVNEDTGIYQQFFLGSKDGEAWKGDAIKTDINLIPAFKLVWDGKVFISLNSYINYTGSEYSNPLVYTSKDGIKWSKAAEIKCDDGINDVICNKGIVIAVGGNKAECEGVILSSINYKNWSVTEIR
jgi:hypothetical protein